MQDLMTFFSINYCIVIESKIGKTVPYFQGKYLHEAAALNGGNAVSTFISFVKECLHSFGNPIEKGLQFQ